MNKKGYKVTVRSQELSDINYDTGSLLTTSLQSTGVKIQNPIQQRKGGAGPADGITIILNGRSINVSVSGNYVSQSPYSIQLENETHFLYKNRYPISKVSLPDVPRYYSLKTHDGIPYNKIALLHGSSCLASTIFQNCIYWDSDKRCTFCGIELSLETNTTILKKTPQQLLEVSKAAVELDKVRHVTLTTGTQAHSSDELQYLATCCSTIKSETNLPIHVQFSPPTDLKLLNILKKAGADTVGIHIESFDFNVLKNAAPCKAELGLKTYIETWKEAISLFGKNQVSSFIILGLGEENESIIEGASLLCELGVYPFILPLRPIPGTPFANNKPPSPTKMISIYQQVSALLKIHDLSWKKSKAGCVRCGACSALPDFEDE